MNLPKRRRPQKMNCNQPPQIRSAGHLQWIRGHTCSINDHACGGRIEAAHVRNGTDCGTSLRPGDNWTIPLCVTHHRDQHQIGERGFEAFHKIDMKAIAAELWRRSPHAKKLRTP